MRLVYIVFPSLRLIGYFVSLLLPFSVADCAGRNNEGANKSPERHAAGGRLRNPILMIILLDT